MKQTFELKTTIRLTDYQSFIVVRKYLYAKLACVATKICRTKCYQRPKKAPRNEIVCFKAARDYTGRHAWQLSTLIPPAKRASAQFSFFKRHLSLFTYLPVPIVMF